MRKRQHSPYAVLMKTHKKDMHREKEFDEVCLSHYHSDVIIQVDIAAIPRFSVVGDDFCRDYKCNYSTSLFGIAWQSITVASGVAHVSAHNMIGGLAFLHGFI